MVEFFKSLSSIGDTLQDNRIRNDRASALAGLPDSTDPADYDAASRKLIGLGDLQGAMSLAAIGQKLVERKHALDRAAMFNGAFMGAPAGAWRGAAANPAPPPASKMGEGSTATNQRTGKKVVLRDGQWVPLP